MLSVCVLSMMYQYGCKNIEVEAETILKVPHNCGINKCK